jgi:hypothetical protein
MVGDKKFSFPKISSYHVLISIFLITAQLVFFSSDFAFKKLFCSKK